jgi:hypothetical protein
MSKKAQRVSALIGLANSLGNDFEAVMTEGKVSHVKYSVERRNMMIEAIEQILKLDNISAVARDSKVGE